MVVSSLLLDSSMSGGSQPAAPLCSFLAGGLYAQPLFYAAVPYYMARGPPDSPAGLVGGPAGVAGHSPPGHPSAILSMDALKARIMEAAPGQVKHAICSAQFVPRCGATGGGQRPRRLLRRVGKCPPPTPHACCHPTRLPASSWPASLTHAHLPTCAHHAGPLRSPPSYKW